MIEADERAFVSVRHARIPNMVSQVNATNDQVNFLNTDTNVMTTIDIPHGNYTGPQLATTFGIGMAVTYGAGATVGYDATSGRFVFSNGSAQNLAIVWFVGKTVHKLFGFPYAVHLWPINAISVSPRVAKLVSIPVIHLHSNMTLSHTYDNKLNGRSTMLETFPIMNASIGTDLFFSNQNTEFRAEFVGKQLSDIELWLTDPDYNILQFIQDDEFYTVSVLIQIEKK